MHAKTTEKQIANFNTLVLIRDSIRVSLLAAFLFMCGFNLLEIILSGVVGLIMASNSSTQKIYLRMQENMNPKSEELSRFAYVNPENLEFGPDNNFDPNGIEAEQSPEGHFHAWRRISENDISTAENSALKSSVKKLKSYSR